jgi:hypothetical protein
LHTHDSVHTRRTADVSRWPRSCAEDHHLELPDVVMPTHHVGAYVWVNGGPAGSTG